MTQKTRFSIVINTDGRAESLGATLESLRWLNYQDFEVCVVTGPTRDGTDKVVARWDGIIRHASCPVRNISVSRNIGIAMAAGDVVAFLDDDAFPEPEWLEQLAAAYEDPKVGGAGGFTHDSSGVTYQYRFGTVNRTGEADLSWTRAAPELNFPYTANFPHLLGTNCSFRRTALNEIGGFDEEYEYYLDETDVCCRLVDAGWHIAQIEGAYVHHKFRPSAVRNQAKIVTNWYPIIKNKIYFSLHNGASHVSIGPVIADTRAFVEKFERDITWAISQGYLTERDRARFYEDVDRAWRDGLLRGLTGTPKHGTFGDFAENLPRFHPFAINAPSDERRTFCFLTRQYPPGPVGGIGRYIHQLARAVAALGHHVHVVTSDSSHDRVDFEDGVWVHRLVACPASAPEVAVPPDIWAYAATVLNELRMIGSRRPITAVYAPIWDCEGAAVLLDGQFPLVTSLQTTLRFWLESHPHLAADVAFQHSFIEPMLALETRMLRQSPGLHAISTAIARDISQAYGVTLDPARTDVIPLGLEDWTHLAAEEPPPRPAGSLRLLFVGRLEARKGIDVLLEVLPRLLERFDNLYVDIAGNDTIAGPDGRSYRAAFETQVPGSLLARITFHGEVTEEQLRGLYQACALFVAPSRFESFGLILVEAMMFGKPAIVCRAGGMVEVLEEGVTGLLAEPGDAASLATCLETLMGDDALRARMGGAARARYEAGFTPERMASRVVEFLLRTAKKYGETQNKAAERSLSAFSPSGGVSLSQPSRRIAIIAPVVMRYDAISASVRDMCQALQAMDDVAVSVLTHRSDFSDLPVQIVGNVVDLQTNRAFRDADLLIFHFGIYAPLFDAILLGNGHARRVVCFHNVTPLELVQGEQRAVIERSFEQIHNIAAADEIWADSEVNKRELLVRDIPGARIHVVPIAVDYPPLGRATRRTGGMIEALFVGRIVPAKGVLDLVKALAMVHRRGGVSIRLKIAGNTEWSDGAYLQEVRATVTALGLDDQVTFVSTVDDETLARLYASAHVLAIPSYHEGFCKPAIEAMRAGCVPVGYAAHNLAFIADGLCRMVTPGDIAALADALAETADALGAFLGGRSDTLLALDRGPMTVAAFEEAATAHVAQFTLDCVGATQRSRAEHLLRGGLEENAGAP